MSIPRGPVRETMRLAALDGHHPDIREVLVEFLRSRGDDERNTPAVGRDLRIADASKPCQVLRGGGTANRVTHSLSIHSLSVVTIDGLNSPPGLFQRVKLSSRDVVFRKA